jgi:F0F1-type ATP synthase delta subunit
MPSRKQDETENIDEVISTKALSAEERRKLRKLIENEERVQWFWASVRVWASWISGAIIGAWALVEIAGKIWKRTF